MAHLIDKDALVAEIKKRLLPVIKDKHYDEWEEGQDSERIAILDIINTIEVKEVDLDEEIEKCLKRHNMLAVGKKDFTDIAKHFFELGMAVSSKSQKGE